MLTQQLSSTSGFSGLAEEERELLTHNAPFGLTSPYGEHVLDIASGQRLGDSLPTESDAASLDQNLDYQDVKLKIIQQEGYDAHDFNLFDDRSSTLWRKPYVDGAVRELTSGDSRSQEQMRQAVEQIMIGAGTLNPDVPLTRRKAHRARANVTVSADVDDEQDLLTDMRRSSDHQVPS